MPSDKKPKGKAKLVAPPHPTTRKERARELRGKGQARTAAEQRELLDLLVDLLDDAS